MDSSRVANLGSVGKSPAAKF